LVSVEIKALRRLVKRRNGKKNIVKGWKGNERRRRRKRRRKKVDSSARSLEGRRSRTIPLPKQAAQDVKLQRPSALPSHQSRTFHQYHHNLLQPMVRTPDTLSMWRERFIG
jgi:hypothetical protein